MLWNAKRIGRVAGWASAETEAAWKPARCRWPPPVNSRRGPEADLILSELGVVYFSTRFASASSS
jgi:hypothetical protein